MKACLLAFLVIVGYYNVSAHYCTSDEKLEKIFAENTEAEFLMQQKYLQIRESTRVLKSMTERNTNHPTVRIPVVWHVLYDNDEPITKLPMAAIQREMDSINKWFAAENEHFSESSSFFGPVIAQAENLNIVFELAAFDQNGNPFNGVNYVESPIGASCNPFSDDMFFSNQGGADIWEHTEYLNMYTCGLEGGVLGFASFPFSHDPLTDGIVLYYGGVGEPEPFEGIVSVHEIGHFLGLFHTFQGGCDSFGDFVDDTPETPGPAFDRVSPLQACPEMNGATDSLFSVCGGVAMVANVMDYNYASCNRYFSKGQAEIMRYWMDTTSVRSSLATSPALGEPCATHNCAGKECGDDGCGGRCGLCDESYFETCISGICVQNLPCPTYDCTDAICGDDGCGGSCGSCFAEQSCFNGICENPNEICSDARIIDAVALMNNPQSYSGSNLGADFSVDCPELGATLEYPVWFKYTANMDGVLTVDTIGSGYDTALALFSGSCASLTCMEYNDDIVLYYNQLSEISISVVNGNDYFIAVGGFAEEQGEFLLNVKISCANFDCGGGRECGDDGCGGSCGTCSSPLTCNNGFCTSANDECAQAAIISISGVDGETLSYEAVTAANNDFQGCGYEELYQVIWYTFTTSSNHQIVIDTVGSQFDTTLAVFSGSCGSLTCEKFNGDTVGLQSEVVVAANSGVQYFIAVGGFSGQDFGSVQLNVNVQCETYDCFDKECGSDGCSGQCGSCETNFICGSSNTCEFLPPCPQYDCTDKFCGADGCGGFCGTCSDEQQCLNGYCESPNDYCSSATNIVISPDGTFYPGFVSEVGADEVICGQRVLPNPVWYAFTVTQLTRVYLSSNSDRFDSQLAILSGDCGSLTCEVFNEDPSELKPYVGAEIEFLAQPGVNYKVAVGSDNISYSDFFLEVLELPLDSPSSSSTPPPSVPRSPAAPSVSHSPAVPSATRSPVNDQSPSSSRTSQPNSFSDDSSSSRDDDDNSSNSTNNSSDDSDSRSSSSSSAMQLPVACVVTLLFALFNL